MPREIFLEECLEIILKNMYQCRDCLPKQMDGLNNMVRTQFGLRTINDTVRDIVCRLKELGYVAHEGKTAVYNHKLIIRSKGRLLAPEDYPQDP